MSKHSKNNTGSSVFTYMERKRLKQKNEWGLIEGRISEDSQKNFELCSICLSKAKNPVCCLKGSIFCKQCLLENLLHQKAENKKKLKEYEETQKITENEINNKNEEKILSAKIYKSNKDTKNCFWLPSMSSNNKNIIQAKPSNILFCPSCEKKHQMGTKDYIELKLIPSIENPENKFMCSICEKILNIQKIIALKKCGHVFCLKCIEKFKNEKKCQICSNKYNDIDIINLKSTGTSFSSHNNVTSKIYVPSYHY